MKSNVDAVREVYVNTVIFYGLKWGVLCLDEIYDFSLVAENSTSKHSTIQSI